MRKFIFLYLIILCCCTQQHSSDTASYTKIYNDLTLHYNKPEDSLKREAVDFLFQNKNHYEAQSVVNYSSQVDQDTTLTKYKKLFLKLDTLHHLLFELTGQEILHIADSVNRRNGRIQVIGNLKTYDSTILTSEYLINNIDLAFESWARSPWKQDVSFDDFCEYVLPYRILHEGIEIWRPNLFYQQQLTSLKKTSLDLTSAYKATLDELDKLFLINNNLYKDYPFKQSLGDLLKGRVGVCLDACLYRIAILRSKGMPVALDAIPHWGNIASWHYMPKLIGLEGSRQTMTNENLPIKTGDIVDVSSAIEGDLKSVEEGELPPNIYVQYVKTVPKVYRHTYSVQPPIDSILRVIPAREVVPEILDNTTIDVTDEYVASADVEIHLNKNAKANTIVYFCVFDVNGWEPVGFGLIRDGNVMFKKAGKNVVFLPCVINNKLEPAGDPFYINNAGNVVPIRSEGQTESVNLVRKYPFFAYTAIHSQRMKGGRFEGSETADFKKPVLLHTIDYYPLYWNDVKFSSPKMYRYIRFVPPNGITAELAEMELLSATGKKIHGDIIGVQGSETHGIEKAFDRNISSYYQSSDYWGGWIGLDVGQSDKEPISTIRFCPRNDTNCIMPGDAYELYYWNGEWRSLGKRKATSATLQYVNVPKGALLWLKDLSGGSEERIFTYANEVQRWW